MMLKYRLRKFFILREQVGIFRSLKISFMWAIKKVLMPDCNMYYSQTGEDVILNFILDKHLGRRDVTYIDVGCHDPIRISSSYLLYLQGSKGLVIDMNKLHADKYKRERPKDVFVCAAVSDKAGETVVYEYSRSEVNTISERQAKIWDQFWAVKEKRIIKMFPLKDLVNRYFSNAEIDVLLLDVEGHELEVLKGSDLLNLSPKVIVSEIHNFDLMNISSNVVASYLIEKGYILVAFATMNAYFIHPSLIEDK